MTEVDICNNALALLGHDRTVSALDDGTAEAARCALFYPVSRDHVLAAFAWEFATKEVEVSADPYELPADCLRVVSVTDARGVVPSTRAGGSLTASRPGVLRYVSNGVPAESLPPMVVDAVVAELAFRLFGPVVGNPNSKDEVEVQQGFSALARAKLDEAKAAEIEEHAYAGAPSASEVTALDLCNRALALLGNDRTVWSLEKDPSAEAVRCRQLLPMAVRHVLAAHPWEFAQQSASVVDGQDVPADFVSLVSASGADGRPAGCRVQGGRVCGAGVESIRYVSSSVPVGRMPATVQNAVALALAVSLSSTVQANVEGGAERFASVRKQAEEVLAQAVRAEIEEAVYRATPSDPSEVARTDVSNRALSAVGSPVVLKDYETDTTPEANRCRQFLPVAVRMTLQGHDWDFAAEERQIPLAPDPSGWSRVAMPDGCARLVWVHDPLGHKLRAKRTGGSLYVFSEGVACARVRYVSDDVDLSCSPPEFVGCVVARLAALVSGSLVQRAEDRARLAAAADMELASVATAESNETATPGEWENPFLKARR